MNNNNDYTEKLVRYLDGELSETESADLRTELADNTAMQEEMDNLLFTKAVIKNYGLTQKVNSIHREMMEETPVIQYTAKPVRSLASTAMRIAAGIILLAGLFSLYQYLTVSSGKLYNEQYTAYREANMRGGDTAGAVEKAYNEKKYDTVIALYKQIAVPTASEQFLTGQAYLNKADHHNAVIQFGTLLEKNRVAGTTVLNDETEYYLALSYLKNNETAKAIPLFEKIHDDKDHLYHTKISSWYLAKLKLLNWKN